MTALPAAATPPPPRLILAPMEGVIDHAMRRLLTDLGGYDRCVTEFVRVTRHAVPAKVFRRLCPELERGGRTRAGVPVYVQLLGSDTAAMAGSAVVAAAAGAPGIDLNFGCPAKIVNRHAGGSVLLQQPERVGAIVAAVRQAVDPAVPVCAKIRLGYRDAERLPEIVGRIADAGAAELCIHARTRDDGYRPPAHWHRVGRLERPPGLRLIVNGEIWNADDAGAARAQSGCRDLMLGRGALACPDLARIVAGGGPGGYTPLCWRTVAGLVDRQFSRQRGYPARYAGDRTKQWLAYLLRHYPGAAQLFRQIKRLTDPAELAAAIALHRRGLAD